MKKLFLLSTPVLMLAIAACGSSPEEKAAEAEKPMETAATDTMKDAAPSLAVTEQGSYTCADSSVVKVDVLGAKEAATITVGTNAPIRVDAPKDAEGKIVANRAMKSADGATVLAGGGDSINLTLAGKGAQSCKK